MEHAHHLFLCISTVIKHYIYDSNPLVHLQRTKLKQLYITLWCTDFVDNFEYVEYTFVLFEILSNTINHVLIHILTCKWNLTHTPAASSLTFLLRDFSWAMSIQRPENDPLHNSQFEHKFECIIESNLGKDNAIFLRHLSWSWN